MTKGYTFTNSDLEEIYETDGGIDLLSDKSITHYRTKTIKSGNILEYEIYPVWDTRSAFRKAKTKASRDAQKRLNAKNAVKNVIRLINTNFTDNDIWATFTYSPANLPSSEQEAQKVMSNYVRRLKRYAAKHNFPPLKYVYTTELGDKKKRIHHHIVVNFPDRDVMEKLWHGGGRCQTRWLRADESGYEGLSRYITKRIKQTEKPKKGVANDIAQSCRVVTSKNLQKPQITVSDCKITRRRIKRIVRGEVNNAAVFEQMSKYRYKLTDITIKTSDYVSGAYIYAKMIKRE